MLSNRRSFLQGAASAKVAPVTLQDRSYEPLKLPRPISLAAHHSRRLSRQSGALRRQGGLQPRRHPPRARHPDRNAVRHDRQHAHDP